MTNTKLIEEAKNYSIKLKYLSKGMYLGGSCHDDYTEELQSLLFELYLFIDELRFTIQEENWYSPKDKKPPLDEDILVLYKYEDLEKIVPRIMKYDGEKYIANSIVTYEESSIIAWKKINY